MEKREIVETLEKARALIERHDLAYDAYETGMGKHRCYCTVGAIIKVMHPEAQMGLNSTNSYGKLVKTEDVSEVIKHFCEAINALDKQTLYYLNDASTKKQVLDRFDAAIRSIGNDQ